MNKYQIEIKETLSRVINISANSEEEALGAAMDMYAREDVVLDYEDLKGVSFDTIEEKEED